MPLETSSLAGAPLARVTSWVLLAAPSFLRLGWLVGQVELQVAPPFPREGGGGQGGRRGTGRRCWAGAGLLSGAGGRSQLLRPAPPHLSLFRGYLVQGLVPAVPLAWQAASRGKWLVSEHSSSLGLVPCTAAPRGSTPPPVPSAWDSPPLWGNAVPWVSPLLHLGNGAPVHLGGRGRDPAHS